MQKKYNWQNITQNEDIKISLIAITIGIFSGILAMVFRESLDALTNMFFQTGDTNIITAAKNLSPFYIIGITTFGGLCVGILATIFLPKNRPQGMTEVLEVSLKKNHKITLKSTIGSFFINIICLSTGGSAGREGPVVHLVSGILTFTTYKFPILRQNKKLFLGCAAAAAVGASFNAPIAGVFFAAELITGTYMVAQFVPIVLASLSGTFLSYFIYGDYPAFILNNSGKLSLYTTPIFILLGVMCALVAIIFMKGIDAVFQFAKRKKIPIWLCPAIGGLGVGLLGSAFPEILGVGYFTTDMALAGSFSFKMLVMLLLAKLLATVLTVGFGGGGGIFSPSLFLGAFVGAIFGILTLHTAAFFGGDLSLSYVAFPVAGMGAFAGAVLGAPLSTVFMIFELTGDYSMTLAVMVATFVAVRTLQSSNFSSFFVWQLKNRGVNVKGSAETVAMRDILVSDIMRDDFVTVGQGECLAVVREKLQKCRLGDIFVIDDNGKLVGDVCLYTMADKAFDTCKDSELNACSVADMETDRVRTSDTLEDVLEHYRAGSETVLAVVNSDNVLVGVLHENDVLLAYKDIVKTTRGELRV